ncbi:MAG: aminotransferase class III-fold pyridoxal phosphate-dependent enzyme [Candidatus Micrarchaeaceae archaeon]
MSGGTPDIMCISKSIGVGISISSIAYRSDFDQLPKPFHLGTYRGNSLGMAVGAAVFEVVRDEKSPKGSDQNAKNCW